MPGSNPALLAVLAFTVPAAFAASGPGLSSGAPTVHLVAVVQEKLGLQSATSSERLFLQPDRIARGEQPIQITTSWNLGTSRTVVLVKAYFEQPDGTAMELGHAGPGTYGPSSLFGKTLVARPDAVTRGLKPDRTIRGVEVVDQRLTPGVNHLASLTDKIDLLIDLKNRSELPATTLQGTLTLVAQAY